VVVVRVGDAVVVAIHAERHSSAGTHDVRHGPLVVPKMAGRDDVVAARRLAPEGMEPQQSLPGQVW
jgi:hypothetical protein